MPPAAIPVTNDFQSAFCCGAFDIGEIEIEVHVDGDKNTQIIVFPHEDTSSNNNYEYLGSERLDQAESFDSTDEIIEGSNEMKLMRRVVEKQRIGKQIDFQQIQRQDSNMSDTNSVNANDVFVPIEDSKEMEYLNVLDQHLNQTNPRALDYDHLEDETEDSHPKKYQANLDDIIEHLCAAPCGGCMPVVDPMDDGILASGGYPRSVLRKPKYSSPDLYTSKFRLEDQPILIRSSSEYNPTSPNDSGILHRNTVRFQHVDIRLLKMTLGNHPSATTGPPVMLDGELAEPRHLARKIMALEQYEQERPPRRKRRQLKLTLQQRHNILVKERGFSFEEVKGAWQESLQIRRQRKETLERGLAMMKWDEVWESTCRKLGRLVDVTL